MQVSYDYKWPEMGDWWKIIKSDQLEAVAEQLSIHVKNDDRRSEAFRYVLRLIYGICGEPCNPCNAHRDIKVPTVRELDQGESPVATSGPNTEAAVTPQSERLLLPLGVMARRVHVSPQWLRAEAESGRIPCLRAGERFLFVSQIVEQLLIEWAGSGCNRREALVNA